MEKNKDIYYFSGTHWDREWYQTFQAFRYRLVDMMDGLLKGMETIPEFKVFHLDGQTIVLEDYAEIEPENAEKLKKYIAEDRIKIGPWYVMPDEFNLSGESLIRNLMIGHALSKKWGAKEAWKFGYICDIFGHIAQMPQIFNGFGIKYSLQCRGYYSDSDTYFIWRSPDGSECLNFRPGNKNGYGEFDIHVVDKERGMALNTLDAFRENAKKYLEYYLTTTKFPIYVLMDALDHMPMHYETPEYIKIIEELVPDANVHHVDLLEAAKQLEKYRDSLEVVTGELNKTNKSGFPDVITNTLSSHYPLKKANDECQNRLEKVIEPMLAFASMANKPLNRNYLKLAYKYLIQNHPHDSICGCSIDQVHKDMVYRFDQTKELCDVLEAAYLVQASRPYMKAVGKPSDAILTLYNTLPYDRDEVVTVDLNMKSGYPTKYCNQPFGYESMNSFKVVDFEGNEIPYQLNYIRNSQVKRIQDQATEVVDVYNISFRAFMPAGGKSEYRIVESAAPSRYLKHLESGVDYMENDFVRVDINSDGTISVLDKKTGRAYKNQLTLADNSEIGDGWYHSDAKEDRTVYSGAGNCHIEKIESGCAKCTFRIVKEMCLPTEMIQNNVLKARSDSYTTCTATFDVSLSENARCVEVALTFDNRAKDHRLRLVVPTYTDGDTYFAGQAFYCCERNAGIDYTTQNWREYEQYEKAMNGIVGRRSADGIGLAFVSAEGLHECGSTDDKNASLYVTLLRAFRRTVATNGETRGQLLGEHTYKFALVPLDETVSYADLLTVQDKLAVNVTSGYREIEKDDKTAAPQTDFKLCGESIRLSILKCAEREKGAYVARIFNASDKVSEAVMEFGKSVEWAKSVNLNEEESDKPLEVKGNKITSSLGAWQIATIMFKI